MELTTATPLALPMAKAAPLPRIVPTPRPMKGAANPPVKPIKAPPAIVAKPTDANRLISRIFFLLFVSSVGWLSFL